MNNLGIYCGCSTGAAVTFFKAIETASILTWWQWGGSFFIILVFGVIGMAIQELIKKNKNQWTGRIRELKQFFSAD